MTHGIIFDMDGTLFETGEGIKASAHYAAKAVGMPPIPENKLNLFIGPSLYYCFTVTLGYDETIALKAIDAYREHYSAEGLMMSRPYDGVSELLDALHNNGYILSVASNKPLVMVQRLLDHYDYTRYFARVTAPDFARRSSDKTDMILAAVAADRSVMVGDTHFDIEGAHSAQMKAIAALYGYGAAQTLADADAQIATPAALLPLLQTRSDLFE